MSGRYIPHDDIAAIVGISDETLRRYYREELDRGKAMGNLDIADRLHKKAKEGNVAALIFLAKIRLKWSEKIQHEHTGKDGGPINVFMNMSVDDLKKRIAEIDEALGEMPSK